MVRPITLPTDGIPFDLSQFLFSYVNYMRQLATNPLVYFLSGPDRFDQVLAALRLI